MLSDSMAGHGTDKGAESTPWLNNPRGPLRSNPTAPLLSGAGAMPVGYAGIESTAHTFSPPNKACQLLFGVNTSTAPIDVGFPQVSQFDHGVVDVRPGSDVLDLKLLQEPLTTFQKASSCLFLAAGGVGLAWLTLVQVSHDDRAT